jgi:hypothetical protein
MSGGFEKFLNVLIANLEPCLRLFDCSSEFGVWNARSNLSCRRNSLQHGPPCVLPRCHHAISAKTRYPLDVLVASQFKTWPGVTVKYSGRFAGISTALEFAVITAVLPMVAQIADVLVTRTCRVWLPKYVENCVAPPLSAVTVVRSSLELGCFSHIPIG